MKEQQLTSVKVDVKLFNEFKISSIKYKFSLQKLADRSMFLFLTDPDYRKRLMNLINTDFESK